MYKKIVVFAILFLIGWATVEASSQDSLKIVELQRIIAECKDPLKVPPGIFKEIAVLRGVEPRPDFKVLRGIKDPGLVHLFVDSYVYPAIQTNFDQFVADLQAEGYTVSITQVVTETAEDIRATLQSEYASGLVGVILVGEVPAAWVKLFAMTHNYTSHFPTDYFYMDLDGTWGDGDADGFYDNFSGSMEPEIWAGRITPSFCIFGDEVTLLNQYFAKNHAYRTGSLALPDRALGYIEIPWYIPHLDEVYGDVTIVIDEDVTTALDYKYMLQQGYEWVHLLSHSSPWGSTFFLDHEAYGGGSVFSYEMPHVNPQAHFVILEACSNAKYTETNNLGQAYIFGSDYGLVAIGETKIMYGNSFEELYEALATGDNLGEAFLDWMWWYWDFWLGCNLFGDPTLKPHGHGNPLSLGGFSADRMTKGSSEWDTSPVDVSSYTDGNPSACVDHSGNIWAAWNAGRDVRANIWASHYDGSSWSTPEEPAFSVPWDFHPSMVTDNSGNVWIFWQSYRVVDYSIDGWDIFAAYHNGSSWSNPIQVTTAEQYDVEPKAALDSSGNVWVVWRTERKPDSDIMYSYYNGSSWSTPAYVSSLMEEERDPVITVDKYGKPWVFWYAKKNGNWDIYGKYYTGSAWSPEKRVTDDPGYDLQPSVTSDASGKVWVLWRSNRDGNLDIYCKYWSGAAWSPAVPVTTDPGDDLYPSVAYDGGDHMVVTWQTNRDGDWNIYQSTYEGGWSTPSPVTSDEGNQIQPAAFFDGNNQFGSVFPGDQEENWNIYYSYTTAQWFAPAVNYEAGDSPYSVFCADLDGDSDMDLAVANAGSDNVSILKNIGDGTFQIKVDYGAGDQPRSVFCADLDGDSDLDLALTNTFSDNVSILKNDGDGTFQTKVDYSTGDGPYSVFCADLDGDCDLDLAVANYNSHNVSILKNNGNGTFQTKVDYGAGDNPISVFCGDLDGDLDMDLVTANINSDNVSILKNYGNGTFETKVDYGAGDQAASVFCADLDGDSDLDLAVANVGSDNVSILKNIGDGTFQTKVDYGAGDRPFSVFCADLDGDLDLDLAVANAYSDNVSILKNNGDGTFQTKVDYGAADGPLSVFCADLDGDLDLDLAVANSLCDSTSILVNLTQVPGNSPPYPFPLLSPEDGDTTSSIVDFDWATVYDPNLGDQIRYDLYFSTVPDFDPDSTTVYDSLTCSQFTDTLSVDRYYWKVRAYDNWGAETWSDEISWHFIYFIRGDVTGDGAVDVGDVVFLVNYLYRGGPAPDPVAAGDVNCDGVVDVGDVVYLVNYLYRGGSPPCD
ncbi:MAG: FG-GAP-like repeat-containing protein [Candidatus Zixiibacteriota bacterium]